MAGAGADAKFPKSHQSALAWVVGATAMGADVKSAKSAPEQLVIAGVGAPKPSKSPNSEPPLGTDATVGACIGDPMERRSCGSEAAEAALLGATPAPAGAKADMMSNSKVSACAALGVLADKLEDDWGLASSGDCGDGFDVRRCGACFAGELADAFPAAPSKPVAAGDIGISPVSFLFAKRASRVLIFCCTAAGIIWKRS